MRFLSWTAACWALLFLMVLAVDVGYTLHTGTQASHAVTAQIDFEPDGSGIVGWMERTAREIDRRGDVAFGRVVGLGELFIYGIVAPLFVVVPLGWEAHRRDWPVGPAGVIIGAAALCIAAWLAWKYPDATAVYYALVNALLIGCRAIGMSYYSGSFVYFIMAPLAFFVGYNVKCHSV